MGTVKGVKEESRGIKPEASRTSGYHWPLMASDLKVQSIEFTSLLVMSQSTLEKLTLDKVAGRSRPWISRDLPERVKLVTFEVVDTQLQLHFNPEQTAGRPSTVTSTCGLVTFWYKSSNGIGSQKMLVPYLVDSLLAKVMLFPDRGAEVADSMVN